VGAAALSGTAGFAGPAAL